MKSKPASLSPAFSALEQFQRDHVRPRAGRTLIVGSQIYREKEDRRKRYADVVGADMQPGPGVDLVIDLEEPLRDGLGQFDHIECMSVLEHSRRPWLLAANLERLMKPDATIFVSVPFVWRFHGYPNDYFRYTPEGIKALFPGVAWTASAFAAQTLIDGHKLRVEKFEGHPYLPRSESVAFGTRK